MSDNVDALGAVRSQTARWAEAHGAADTTSGATTSRQAARRLDEAIEQQPIYNAPLAIFALRSPAPSAAHGRCGASAPAAYPGNAARVADAHIALEESLRNAAFTSAEDLARYIDEYTAYTQAKSQAGPAEDAARYGALYEDAAARGPELLANRLELDAHQRELDALQRRGADQLRHLSVSAPLPVQQMAALGEAALPLARTADALAQCVPLIGPFLAALEAVSGKSLGGLGPELEPTERAVSAALLLAPAAAALLVEGVREGAAVVRLARATGRTAEEMRAALLTVRELNKDREVLQQAFAAAKAGRTLSPDVQAKVLRAQRLLTEFGGASPYGRSPLSPSANRTTFAADGNRLDGGAMRLRSPSTGTLRDSLPVQAAAVREAPLNPSGPIPVGIPTGPDGLPRINGRLPINAAYAGRQFPLAGPLGVKYPNGVMFKANGMPDFTPYAVASLEVDGLVGDIKTDYRLANRAAGLEGQYGNQAPPGYTWHHCEDGKTMQLVPTDVHHAVKHTGGEAVIKHVASSARGHTP